MHFFFIYLYIIWLELIKKETTPSSIVYCDNTLIKFVVVVLIPKYRPCNEI